MIRKLARLCFRTTAAAFAILLLILQAGACAAAPTHKAYWRMIENADGAPVRLMHTDDGRHWRNVMPAPAQRLSANVVDGTGYGYGVLSSRFAYLIMPLKRLPDEGGDYERYRDSVGPYRAFRTVDGGTHWSALRIRALVDGQQFVIRFIDPNHGVMVVSSFSAMDWFYKATYRTHDGGRHWIVSSYAAQEAQYSFGGLPETDPIRGLEMRSATDVWLNCENFYGQDGYMLYHSKNAGRTWREVPLRAPHLPKKPALEYYQCDQPEFSGPDRRIGRFVLHAMSDSVAWRIVYRTTDGGVHWKPGRAHRGAFVRCDGTPDAGLSN